MVVVANATAVFNRPRLRFQLVSQRKNLANLGSTCDLCMLCVLQSCLGQYLADWIAQCGAAAVRLYSCGGITLTLNVPGAERPQPANVW